MERVAFLVEDTGERITCLLNPEHVVHRRLAGLSHPSAGSGAITGAALPDTPLLHTGGGRTELDLDLLFDVDLVPAPVTPAALSAPTAGQATAQPGAPDGGDPTPSGLTTAPPPPTPPTPASPRDVRDLTRPLWNLAENSASGDTRRVPHVRFVWGKAWNVLAVVESLAERLERFDSSGTPGRSWLRLRLVRVPEPAATDRDPTDPETGGGELPDADALAFALEDPIALHSVVGGGEVGEDGAAVGGQTLAAIAAAHYGDRPWLWRWLAEANGLDDVVWPAPGLDLVIPPPPEELP